MSWKNSVQRRCKKKILLSVCLSVCLSILCMYLCLCVCPSIQLSLSQFNSNLFYWHDLHSIAKALTIAWAKNKYNTKTKQEFIYKSLNR